MTLWLLSVPSALNKKSMREDLWYRVRYIVRYSTRYRSVYNG